MPHGEYIGYLEYTGSKVQDGILDVEEAARALRGFGSALRYVISREAVGLLPEDIPVPVKIQLGTWEALIPHDIESWIKTAAGLGITSYLASAAKKAGENDFKDVGLKDLFVRGFRCLQWLIKIGKHLRSFTHREISSPKWQKENTEIGIINDDGKYLYVPIKIFEIYSTCPVKLLSDMSSVVSNDCKMQLGVKENEKEYIEAITYEDKSIFYVEDVKPELLFPELEHGMKVELDGLVTKGNETTNSIGFRYQGFILQCLPRHGNIVRFKPHLFLPCRIYGTISRESELGKVDEVKPKIIFDNLEILDDSPDQTHLGI